MSSLESLRGLACTVGAQQGSISISYDAQNHAVLTCSTTSAGTAILRINEFMSGTAESATNEFVEIANAGTASADIGGYKLVYRSGTGTSDVVLATVPTGVTLAAGGFYLFGGAGYQGAHAADQSFSAGLAATAGGVGLRDGGGTLVDSVGWGTATNAFVEANAATAPAAVAAPGASAARLPDGHDTNNNAADFTVPSTPTPGSSNG